MINNNNNDMMKTMKKKKKKIPGHVVIMKNKSNLSDIDSRRIRKRVNYLQLHCPDS